jgi:S-formylglutathione hydrolase
LITGLEQIAANRCFGGEQLRYRHRSGVLACEMTFSIYLPPQASSGKVPLLYWLSGLTCTDENFVIKAGAQQFAAKYGIALVAPDTSPRGDEIPDDPEAAWDFGLGAGFYLNASQPPFDANYRMYDYISCELPELVNRNFPIIAQRCSIFGHSMGGHGALTIALKNPERFRSVSAFSPIVAPMRCPWGRKALSNYLGEDEDSWLQYDATELIARSQPKLPILIDQGDADEFLLEQLRPELLSEAAKTAGYPLNLRMQPGYDHSFFFVSSFIGEHVEFHAKHLQG